MKRLFVLLACLLAVPAQGQILSIIMGGTNQPAATPTFSPVAGAVTNPTTVTASTSTSDGCTIYFDTSNPPVTAQTTYSVTTGVTLYAQARGCAHHRDSLVGSATYTISAGSPTFVAINEYNAPTAFSVTTSSSTCPIGHVRIFIANDAVPTDTLTLTTTTGNAITTRVAYTGVNGSFDAYVQAWTSTCTGSTGTYTLTSTSFYYTQLIDYEASSGTYDTSNACSVASAYGPLSCSITSSGADLVVTSVTNNYSAISPTSGITGWTNRLNISQASAWDQTGSPGTITFSTSNSGVNAPVMTVMIGLHP
jgi:hypothetical protein